MSTTRPRKVGLPAGARTRRKASSKPSTTLHHDAAKASKATRLVSSSSGRKSPEPKWIAWSGDLSKVVAKGATLEAARDAARALGESEPVLEPVQRRARLA